MNKGKVYLVGAGPGAVDLITVKGLKCIQSAEVIVYDRLINKNLLDYAGPKTEKIYVGKSAGRHTLVQEKINELLAERTSRGKKVVRLKGGDPFLFGRGGEELAYLAEKGIGFEVIPGISSLVAAAAYAGIPLTHRDYSSSVGITTGHPAGEETSGIDWQSLAGLETIVFFMGIGNLAKIIDKLIKHNKAPLTPVAIIQDATLPGQKVITGNLDNIVQKAGESAIHPPGLIIIGEVVKLRKKLGWLEQREEKFSRADKSRGAVCAELSALEKREETNKKYEGPAVIAITEKGLRLAGKIEGLLKGAEIFVPATLGLSGDRAVKFYSGSLKELVSELFTTHRALIFIMACGIVVRMISPHLKDKYHDPAVVVVDEGGNSSISLLSGHEGGANVLAEKVADLIGSRAVITTASEISSPSPVVVGIGCHKGISKEELEEAIFDVLEELNLSLSEVRNLATFDGRKNEKGLMEFSRQYRVPLETFTLNRLKDVPLYSEASPCVENALGVKGICEPAALLSANSEDLILKKRRWKNLTMAVARVNST